MVIRLVSRQDNQRQPGCPKGWLLATLTVHDDEIAAVAKKAKLSGGAGGKPVSGDSADARAQGREEKNIQERLQREDAERERKVHDEL